MANYPGPNIATFTLSSTYKESVQITNTFYYEMTSAGVTTSNASQVAEGFQNVVGGLIAAMQTQDITYAGTRVRVFGANALIEGSATGTFTGAIDISDGESGSTLPMQTAMVIRKKVGKFGRKYVGRAFISGLHSTMVEGELISATGRPLAKAIVDYLGADGTFGGVTMHHRHWCRKDNTFEVIQDCFYNTLIKSQRRRRPLRGRIYQT